MQGVTEIKVESMESRFGGNWGKFLKPSPYPLPWGEGNVDANVGFHASLGTPTYVAVEKVPSPWVTI